VRRQNLVLKGRCRRVTGIRRKLLDVYNKKRYLKDWSGPKVEVGRSSAQAKLSRNPRGLLKKGHKEREREEQSFTEMEAGASG